MLTIDWDGSGEVTLRGPAELVFHGEWPTRHRKRARFKDKG